MRNFFYLIFLIFIIGCNQKRVSISKIFPNNRALVKKYVDSVIRNIENYEGYKGHMLLEDSLHLKSIHSVLYQAVGQGSHSTNYIIIIDDSTKKIYNIPMPKPNWIYFLDLDIQEKLLEPNFFIIPIIQENYFYTDFETFLNENSAFRYKFPNREIIDSILSFKPTYYIGHRINNENEIDSCISNHLKSVKQITREFEKIGDKKVLTNLEKYKAFFKRISPLLKNKLKSNFVLLYNSDEFSIFEINPGNNYEFTIFRDIEFNKLGQNNKIDSLQYKINFENKFFKYASHKRSLYKISFYKIGYNYLNVIKPI